MLRRWESRRALAEFVAQIAGVLILVAAFVWLLDLTLHTPWGA